jgi:uncharacterized protein (TIGR02217 family)
MAFYEIQFPTDISWGAICGPSFKTDIAILDSGYEARNASWSSARLKYDVTHKIRTKAEMDQLDAFFRAVRGRAHGFRFKDWRDYQATNEPLPFGTSATIQLQKTYTSGSNTEVRTITKPVSGTVTARKNSVSTPVTFSTTTGILTLTAGAPLITDVIDWTGEFDVPVRFDMDDMQVSIDAPGIHSWNRITLVEIRL